MRQRRRKRRRDSGMRKRRRQRQLKSVLNGHLKSRLDIDKIC